MKKYTRSHEWIDSDNGKVGITTHALEALGDIVFLELPENGTVANQGDSIAVIESHKTASDIYAPVSGTIDIINQAAMNNPEDILIGEDLWLFSLKDINTEELKSLLNEDAYKIYLTIKQ